MYAVVISKFGNAKMAMTTSININFFGRPGPGIQLAFGRALKVGKRLAVINVEIKPHADDPLIAQATGTCSLPMV